VKRGNDPASGESQQPRGIQERIADADKKARTGSTEQRVRNAPPAAACNDSAAA